jgi:hypothetical protein
MSIEERLSQARTEMQDMFTETEVPEVGGVQRRSRRRTAMRTGAGALALGALVFGAVAVLSDDSDSRGKVDVADDNTTTTVVDVAASPVVATIELPKDTYKIGDKITGTLVLTNNTDTGIDYTEEFGCTPKWNVSLVEKGEDGLVGFTDECGAEPFVLEPGINEFTFEFETRGRVRNCDDPTLSSLCEYEPGEYDLVLSSREADFPEAERVTITLTEDGGATGVLGPDLEPGTIIGATDDGRVVKIYDDGSIGDQIAQLPEGVLAGQIEINGDDVWFIALENDDSCGALMRMPLAGGEAETIVEQTNGFAVSPDGSRVSYTEHLHCPEPGPDQAAVITMDLATSTTHEWRAPSPEQSDDFFNIGSAVSDIAWSPDGSRLAIQWCYEGCWTQLHDPNVDGVYDDAGAPFAEHPTFVNGTLYEATSVYGEPGPEPLLTIQHYESLDAEPTERSSPFTTWPHEMYAGTDDSLLAVVAGPASLDDTGGAFVLERWRDGSSDMTTVNVDPAIRAITTV